MHSLALCLLSCLAGLTAGNWLSPWVGKCLDIALKEKVDAGVTRWESKADLNTRLDGVKVQSVNVQLYECHNDFNQHWRFKDGFIMVEASQELCLEAEEPKVPAAAVGVLGTVDSGVNVHLARCWTQARADAAVAAAVGVPAQTAARNKFAGMKKRQQWGLTEYGYVQLAAQPELCLDAFAEETTDGGREMWDEIRARESINVQLFKCHDHKTTHRKNQLWAWRPFKDGKFVTEKFLLHDLGFKASAPTSLALTLVAISFLIAGVAIGVRRARRVTAFSVPLEPTE